VSAAAYIGAGSAETEAEYSRRRTANASALERFESGDVQWLVATCALGMGIDFKREVRAVLHIGFPPSADDYAQEIGRGGRKGGRCDCVLYASLAMAHQTAVLLCKTTEGEPDERALNRLERFQELLSVLFGDGCRRDALLSAVLGPELAGRCPPCSTCDRCSAGECCEVTGGIEAWHDLQAAAGRLQLRLARRPRELLRCDAPELWSGAPDPVASRAGCSQLVFLMLARRLLTLRPHSGRGGGAAVHAAQRRIVASMRWVPVAAAAASVPSEGTGVWTTAAAPLAAEHERLDRLLSELDALDAAASHQQAKLNAFRCRCARLAEQLGRGDEV